MLRLTGVSKDKAAEFQPATTESLSVDVTRKPLISLVWGGFYVLMTGASWPSSRGHGRRGRGHRETPEKAASPREPVPAPTGPAVPAHGRSRL